MFEFVSTVIKNAFHHPATRDYPRVKREPFLNVRGHVVNHIENCIFCGLCSRKCPAGAIKVNRAEKTWTIDRFRCVACSACVLGCPKKCLSMSPIPTPPANVKSVDTQKQPAAAAVKKPVPAATAKETAATAVPKGGNNRA